MDGIELRFRRDRLGISQGDLAEAMDVTRKTVKCWERGIYPVPADCEEYVAEMEAVFAKGVAAAVGKVADIAEDAGHAPGKVTLTYYRSQSEYDERGRDAGPVGFRNAMTRAAWSKLTEAGFRVDIAGVPAE